MAQDGETSWWEKAAGHKIARMGGHLKAPLETKAAEELQVSYVSHAARKTAARSRRSELTPVDMVFMSQPYSRTVATAAMFSGFKHPAGLIISAY